MSGFAALVAVVEAVVPLLSGSTALGPGPCFSPLRGSTASWSGSIAGSAVVPPLLAVLPPCAGLVGGATVGLLPPL